MVALILIFVAGVFKAFSDKLKVWDSSRWANLPKDNWFYKWAGNGGSWKNKWKLNSNGQQIPIKGCTWYYLCMFPLHFKERFPYSSTFLVTFTDGWHTFQFIMRTAFMFAAIFYNPVLVVVGVPEWLISYGFMSVAYMVGFTLFYDYILNLKK